MKNFSRRFCCLLTREFNGWKYVLAVKRQVPKSLSKKLVYCLQKKCFHLLNQIQFEIKPERKTQVVFKLLIKFTKFFKKIEYFIGFYRINESISFKSIYDLWMSLLLTNETSALINRLKVSAMLLNSLKNIYGSWELKMITCSSDLLKFVMLVKLMNYLRFLSSLIRKYYLISIFRSSRLFKRSRMKTKRWFIKNELRLVSARGRIENAYMLIPS